MLHANTIPQFSDYLIYVDESGDHGLSNINPEYPYFVLSFCIFEKAAYVETVVPTIQKLKLKWWGHDSTILHTIDIKRKKGDFGFLMQRPLHDQFMDDLNKTLESLPFTLIAAVVHKEQLVRKYSSPSNPYDIALMFCMERSYAFLKDRNQHLKKTTIIVEERGTNEDRDLELEFRRIRDGAGRWGEMRNFDLRFCSKKINSSGLQIADLVATPIGRVEMHPEKPNRAYAIIEPKFRKSPQGLIDGWGKKVFP